MMMVHYKMKNIFLHILIFFSLQHQTKSSGGGNWSYFGDGGTKAWKSAYPSCKRRGQSPIDIITPLAESKNYGVFKIENYNAATSQVLLKNTGTTVTANFQLAPRAKISGGGLNQEYIAHSFHFHWGSKDDFGAEHFRDGTSFLMELHIVHYSSKYSDLHEAMDKPEGLAVLGFFFLKTTDNNTVLQNLIQKFPQIQAPDMQINVDAQLGTLIPDDLDKYYRYSGSLTTPPCYESVVWTIFESTIGVSALQMKEFRTRLQMKVPGTKRMLFDNYRHIQPLNRRIIYVNEASTIHHETMIFTLMIGVHFL